jgi:hypothetical protein
MGQKPVHDIPVPVAKCQLYLGYTVRSLLPEFSRAVIAAPARELGAILGSLDAEWQSAKPNGDRVQASCRKLSALLNIPIKLTSFEQHAYTKHTKRG